MTYLGSTIAGMQTPSLLETRARLQGHLERLCEIYADPRSPVRDAKDARRAIERARADLAEAADELRARGLAVDEVPTVDEIKNRARSEQ